MSDNELRDSINQAERSISEQELHARNLASREDASADRGSSLVLGVIAVVLVAMSYFMFQGAKQQVETDIDVSVLDMLMQADAEILTYYDVFGELPAEMPDFALNTFVEYERLDAQRFTLRSRFEDYSTLFERSVNFAFPPEMVARELQLGAGS